MIRRHLVALAIFASYGVELTADPRVHECEGRADETARLQAAIDSAAAAKQSLSIQGICITGPLTAPTGLTLMGPGTIRQKSGTGIQPLLSVSGTGITISGVGFDGNSAGLNGGSLISAHDASQVSFVGNTVFNTVGGQYAFRAINLSNSELRSNRLHSIRGPGISIDDGSQGVNVTGNQVDHTSALDGSISGSAISSMVTNTLGTAVSNIVFAGNTVKESVHFCFESGNFKTGSNDSSLVSSITFEFNSCTIANTTGTRDCGLAVNAAACGGYSMSNAQSGAILNNTYNATGQVVAIAAVEVTSCVQCLVHGNVLQGGSPGSLTPGAMGISVNCASCLISNNQVIGFQDTGNQGGIYIHTTPQFLAVNDTIITGNVITLPARRATAIYANCNNAGGSINRLLVMNNYVTGLGSGSAVTAAANSGSCTLDSAVLGPNRFSNTGYGYLLYRSTNTIYRGAQFNSVSIQIQNNGGSTYVSPYAP